MKGIFVVGLLKDFLKLKSFPKSVGSRQEIGWYFYFGFQALFHVTATYAILFSGSSLHWLWLTLAGTILFSPQNKAGILYHPFFILIPTGINLKLFRC